MLVAEANARMILTDSGGVQKEAYLLSVPCITLREETEWLETVYSGWNVLAGDRLDSVLESASGRTPIERPALFGKGDAGQRIVDALQLVC